MAYQRLDVWSVADRRRAAGLGDSLAPPDLDPMPYDYTDVPTFDTSIGPPPAIPPLGPAPAPTVLYPWNAPAQAPLTLPAVTVGPAPSSGSNYLFYGLIGVGVLLLIGGLTGGRGR